MPDTDTIAQLGRLEARREAALDDLLIALAPSLTPVIGIALNVLCDADTALAAKHREDAATIAALREVVDAAETYRSVKSGDSGGRRDAWVALKASLDRYANQKGATDNG